MKSENIFIKGLNKEVLFYIGKNIEENFAVIEKGNSEDLWFHANKESSCHVIAILPTDIKKQDMRYIIKVGALLCKNNTNKIKKIKNVQIIYTKIKNIEMTNIEGCVIAKEQKIIII